jgi:hypothetical protein
VAFAKLQLKNAQKYLDSAKVFKSLIEQIQKLRKGKNLAGKTLHILKLLIDQRVWQTKYSVQSKLLASNFFNMFSVLSRLLSLLKKTGSFGFVDN